MLFAVIRPFNLLDVSTRGSFSILFFISISLAFLYEMLYGAEINFGSGVIILLTVIFSSDVKIMSRLVRMPWTSSFSLITMKLDTLVSSALLFASLNVDVGNKVKGL